MTGRLLDVTAMPSEQTYVCKDGSEINIREFVENHRPAVEVLAAAGLIKANESFGFAMLAPVVGLNARHLVGQLWDKPEKFVWFVGGWGPQKRRYIANAIRKLRSLLRTGYDSTLEMRFHAPYLFEGVVESQNADGDFPWGDFPWGGAVEGEFGELSLFGATSCLSEIEDDIITRLILGGIGQRIVKGDGLLSDD